MYFRYCNKQVEVYSTGQEKIGEINTGMLEFFEVSRCSSYDNYMLTCLFFDKKTNEGNLSLFRSGDVVPSY